MPWMDDEGNIRCSTGTEILMTASEYERLNNYTKFRRILSKLPCTCGQEKHKLGCPKGFKEYFPLK